MKYDKTEKCIFIKRHNRFVGEVLVNNKKEIVHIKNTGRCREILRENSEGYLEYSKNPNRKTKYSLVTVKKDNRLINIDSQAPNRILEEALLSGLVLKGEKVTYLKRESVYGNSRFDFYFETKKEKGYIEVKGVTLENDNVVSFPDAPTIRGVKHINELIKAKKEGLSAYIVFIIQLENPKYFMPNRENHLLFAQSLENAKKEGVGILAFDCIVKKDEIYLNKETEIKI